MVWMLQRLANGILKGKKKKGKILHRFRNYSWAYDTIIKSAKCYYKQLFKDHFKSSFIYDYSVEIIFILQ